MFKVVLLMDLIYKTEFYKIVGLCMEVHRELGPGFSEVIYKDALEIEFKEHDIPYVREKEFFGKYKRHTLKRKYDVDFIVYDAIIVEAKAVRSLIDDFIGITVNYLKVSGCKLGLLGNFGERSFKYRRIIV